jgi:hypothetical protein
MHFPTRRLVDDRFLQQFAKFVASIFNGLSISTPRDLPTFLLGNPHGDTRVMIAKLISRSHSAHGSYPDLLMSIQHGPNEGIYYTVKNIRDILYDIASQGLLFPLCFFLDLPLRVTVMLIEKSVQGRDQQQHLANIGLKVNAKLGGTTIPFMNHCSKRVVGW